MSLSLVNDCHLVVSPDAQVFHSIPLFQISPANHALLTRENEDRLFGASGTNYSAALSLA